MIVGIVGLGWLIGSATNGMGGPSSTVYIYIESNVTTQRLKLDLI